MANGNSPPREVIQDYQVRITQTAYDILVDEGLIATNGATLFDVQKAIVIKEEEGEVTSSSNTQLAPIGDNRAGTTRIVNGEDQSSGSLVGFGQWVGTFSGSADFFRTGSGFDVFHFTEFSGSMSCSDVNIGMEGTSNYGRVYIGAPSDLPRSSSNSSVAAHSFPRTQAWIGSTQLRPMVFSGSFKCTSDGFLTEESGSASGSRIFGAVTSSNTRIPGGTFSPKWISGSFNNGVGSHKYQNNATSMSADINTAFYTSSTVTQTDLNNISESSFYGSICVASGGFEGVNSFSTLHKHAGNYGGDIFNGGKKLNATCEVAFGAKARFGGQFRNSGSLVDNNNTGALVSGLTGGTIFAIAPSGSVNLVSGSIESITDGGFVNRGPGKPYVDGTAKQSYFTTKRTVSVSGMKDKFQKAARKAAATAKFSPKT